MGFTVLTAIFIVMGFGYTKITTSNQASFAFLYALANFFQNFGPNSTTFVLPGELFPTRYRSTAHGISAASGKLGAVLAQVLLLYAKDIGGPNKSVDHMWVLCSCGAIRTSKTEPTWFPSQIGDSCSVYDDRDILDGPDPRNEGPLARVLKWGGRRPRCYRHVRSYVAFPLLGAPAEYTKCLCRRSSAITARAVHFYIQEATKGAPVVGRMGRAW